jgi:hypothetical protein
MSRLRPHPENHLIGRIGRLRAAVLGANDGIISTATLIVGVSPSAATHNDALIAGVAAPGCCHANGSRRVRSRVGTRIICSALFRNDQ